MRVLGSLVLAESQRGILLIKRVTRGSRRAWLPWVESWSQEPKAQILRPLREL